jgi:hypothetical protein
LSSNAGGNDEVEKMYNGYIEMPVLQGLKHFDQSHTSDPTPAEREFGSPPYEAKGVVTAFGPTRRMDI